ncbi:MAG: uL30 family ribosomal protein [Candidatus Woesearchaeota archaeon]
MKKIAIIRIRGDVRIRNVIRDTFKLMGLYKKHNCVILDSIPSNMGMVEKVKDFVTFGEINDETYKLLIEKRGEKNSEGKIKKTFRLHPPIGGYERKGTKKSFTQKGALGYRGEKINDLIKRMI